MNNAITIKIVIFSIRRNTLCVFLRENDLPQGIFLPGNLDKQVEKIFFNTTSMHMAQDYREQLYTLSAGHTIEIIYYVLLAPEKAEKMHINFSPIELAKEKNHSDILSYAQQRLRWKIEYTNVIYSLLPKSFTLSELQKGYEIILDMSLDKRNFRKKMLSLDFLIPTDKKTVGTTRPAQMYKFKERKPMIIKIFS